MGAMRKNIVNPILGKIPSEYPERRYPLPTVDRCHYNDYGHYNEERQ